MGGGGKRGGRGRWGGLGRCGSAVIGWVDRGFFCSIGRWPLLVARDLGRCFVISVAVRPGHELKWPRLIAHRSVDGSGLKAQAWRKAARSCVVRRWRMAPLATWRFAGGWDASVDSGMVALGARGIFQRPFDWFRWPTMMTWPFFRILTSYLVKRATQSSSHSCPMEIKEPDLRSLKM